ncbi:hypothetical protein OH76DRAFT_1459183 [Lentinus brumalis]|uniref:Prolyl 4-hydroxylase alpha subunit Fe(2+) 2OG dioxygenase domain-containing protein n=1 Tax=Lentinus brumalis TaxID=2498619 RepID=A0A371CM48_9APHY|nr:hypothetical protein OH76DRAFT_1459183 [Polyporus brumalis]
MATGYLKTYVPAVFSEYMVNLNAICESQPELRRNCTHNAFAGVTFNLGPRVVTYPHLDQANHLCGMCAVTVLGNFDHERGGHVILWDVGLVIQVPPRSTYLIPSAILVHSNVDIGPEETRMSITQYSAGHLFSWVRCGMTTQAKFAQNGQELESGKTRWQRGLRLLRKWSAGVQRP